MKDLAVIRKELRHIRYYYARKSTFDEALDTIGEEHHIVCKVKEYNSFMQKAPPKLYDIYYSLYVKHNTQESLAGELNYTPEYVQKLNMQLLRYIQKNMPNGVA